MTVPDAWHGDRLAYELTAWPTLCWLRRIRKLGTRTKLWQCFRRCRYFWLLVRKINHHAGSPFIERVWIFAIPHLAWTCAWLFGEISQMLSRLSHYKYMISCFVKNAILNMMFLRLFKCNTMLPSMSRRIAIYTNLIRGCLLTIGSMVKDLGCSWGMEVQLNPLKG